MTLRELVIEYRTEHGVSQRQFAAQCGLSNGYISMIERECNPQTGEKPTPTLVALNKLATGMHISLNELFSRVDDMDVDVKMPAPNEEGGHANADMEIISLLSGLSDAKKQQALSYLRFLANSGDI